jgi:hypothetical protein
MSERELDFIEDNNKKAADIIPDKFEKIEEIEEEDDEDDYIEENFIQSYFLK